MKFLMLIPYTDLRDERACVHVEHFDADSEAAADAHAHQLVGNWKGLMDLLVEDWEGTPESKGLEGMALLAEHGIRVGDIEVWEGERLMCFLPGVSP